MPDESEVERKFGARVARAGWTPVPLLLLRHQAELGLEPVDVNLLVQLLSFWWVAGRPAHPSVGLLAKRLGVTERTVQRRVRRLERKGMLRREWRRDATRQGPRNLTSLYHLDLLMARLGRLVEAGGGSETEER